MHKVMCGWVTVLHHPCQAWSPLVSLNESHVHVSSRFFHQILIPYLSNTFYMSCLILIPKSVVYVLLVFIYILESNYWLVISMVYNRMHIVKEGSMKEDKNYPGGRSSLIWRASEDLTEQMTKRLGLGRTSSSTT